MNLVRHIVFITLVVFTFVGSIGVGVYSHFCSKDGVEQSFFIQQEHHCKQVEKSLPACCQHENQTIENDCCSDEVHFIQTDFDFFQQISSFLFVPSSLSYDHFCWNEILILPTEISKSNFANPPPKLSGKQILIKNQVFRI